MVAMDPTLLFVIAMGLVTIHATIYAWRRRTPDHAWRAEYVAGQRTIRRKLRRGLGR